MSTEAGDEVDDDEAARIADSVLGVGRVEDKSEVVGREAEIAGCADCQTGDEGCGGSDKAAVTGVVEV